MSQEWQQLADAADQAARDQQAQQDEIMFQKLVEFKKDGSHYDSDMQFPLFTGYAPPGHPYPKAFAKGPQCAEFAEEQAKFDAVDNAAKAVLVNYEELAAHLETNEALDPDDQ